MLLPDGRLFVTEQLGKVRVIQDEVLQTANFIDLSADTLGDQERGLLGITLDPNFATNRHVYLYHTANKPAPHNRIVRVTVSASNPNVADLSTLRTVVDLEDIETPQDTEVTATWHHGGAIHFGADGKLYVAVGDHRHAAYAQDDNTTKGKILRMTINADGSWSVPSDNPFCTTPGLIKCLNYRKGLRNPFTFAIRPTTNDLYIGDVGDSSWEEVNVALAADPSNRRNFGWPTTEGMFDNAVQPNFKRPAYAYAHGTAPGQGCAIVGAGFYPASGPWPAEYHGKFFFMDFCGTRTGTSTTASGVIRTMDPKERQSGSDQL
jgi:glucose/arabinose dehydrogenase